MFFVAHRHRETQDKLGLPTFIHRTFTEKFNEKKPMEAVFSEYSREQLTYNPRRDGVPVPANRRLPPQLLMVCKGLKKFTADFYADSSRQWIVSERFINILKSHNLLEDHYEKSELTIVSTKNQLISDKQHYLLRFFKDDNYLVDFERSSNIASTEKLLTPKTPPRLYYYDLVFREEFDIPSMLYLDQESFWYGFLCTKEIKVMMEEEQFSGFNFYTFEEYVRERQYRDVHRPLA
jgi:Immunity protein 43